jgi:glycosyltransferase involved in cell wall biosynthesis
MAGQAGIKTHFSIVVPTFNSALTLGGTLESIRAQGWSKVEVLIIDGVSRDATLDVAKGFPDLDVVIQSEPDKGIYDAINKGIARARGDLVCVIGSDDLLAPGAFHAVDRVWQAAPTDIVAGRALLVAPDGTSHLREDEAYDIGCLISGIPFCHNSMYVTKAAYARVGAYATNLKICADAEWVHRAIRMECTCARVPEVLIHFSLDGTSSRNDALIMAETYAVVAANFPGLSVADAETLFKAARGWTDSGLVPSVVANHPDVPGLRETVLAKFGVGILAAPDADPAIPPRPAGSFSMARAFHNMRAALRSGGRRK